MKNVIITGATAPKVEKPRKDGKVSREHLTLSVEDAANPFRTVKRTIFQQHSLDGKTASWKVSPDRIADLISKKQPIPGEIVTRNVKRFPVLDASGNQMKDGKGNSVYGSQYTALILEGESVERIFKAAGHELEAEAAPAAQPAQLQA